MGENKMNPIETKELRGLSLKSVYWIVGTTIISCAFFLGIYYSLKADMSKVINNQEKAEAKREESVKYDDLRYRTLEIRVGFLEEEQRKRKQSEE